MKRSYHIHAAVRLLRIGAALTVCILALAVIVKPMTVSADPTAYLRYMAEKWKEKLHYDLVREEEGESEEGEDGESDSSLHIEEWGSAVSGIQGASFYAQISDYAGSAETVVLPAMVEGISVREITAGAFAGNKTVKEVVFEGPVTDLDAKILDEQRAGCQKGAFEDCVNLEKVVIKNGEGAASYAFDKAIHIFAGCEALEAFEVENPASSYGLMSIDGVLYGVKGGVPVALVAYPPGKTDSTYTLPATVSQIHMVPSAANIFDGNPYLEEILVESDKYFNSKDGVLYKAVTGQIAAWPVGREDGTLDVPQYSLGAGTESDEEHKKHRADADSMAAKTLTVQESAEVESAGQVDLSQIEPVPIDPSAWVPNEKQTAKEEVLKEKPGFLKAAKDNLVWILLGVVLAMIHLRYKKRKRDRALREYHRRQAAMKADKNNGGQKQ